MTGNDVSLLQPADRMGSTRRRFSSHTHAVEFSRTDAGEGGQRKGLRSRQRPPNRRGTKRSYPNRTKALQCRRAFRCLPLGRPKECSSPLRPVKKRDRRASRSDACPPAGACRRGPRAARRAPRRGSPSSFTPPWAIMRRASLVERPNAAEITAGRCTGSPSGSACSGTSSGAPPSRTTRVKCASPASAPPSGCHAAGDAAARARASTPCGSTG